jgi:hypothetical protein
MKTKERDLEITVSENTKTVYFSGKARKIINGMSLKYLSNPLTRTIAIQVIRNGEYKFNKNCVWAAPIINQIKAWDLNVERYYKLTWHSDGNVFTFRPEDDYVRRSDD